MVQLTLREKMTAAEDTGPPLVVQWTTLGEKRTLTLLGPPSVAQAVVELQWMLARPEPPSVVQAEVQQSQSTKIKRASIIPTPL